MPLVCKGGLGHADDLCLICALIVADKQQIWQLFAVKNCCCPLRTIPA